MASFFCAGLFFFTSHFSDPATAAPLAEQCRSHHFDTLAYVKQVHDGDTIRLKDGRKLRLIAINTPELARDNQPAEPFAKAATSRLKKLLTPGKAIKLRYGQQRTDRYQRLLAHVFLTDGTNVSTILLNEGLAMHITIPPNTWSWQCYQRAEKKARLTQQGLWAHPYFDTKKVSSLPMKSRGFTSVSGNISHIGHSRDALWLNLGDEFALRIPRQNLKYFEQTKLEQALHKHVQVRGWVYHTRQQLRMNVPHPAAIEWLDN